MKHILILLVCFLCLPFFGQSQNIITAENPIAHQYLLKHFGLQGKVKSITTFGANNYLMRDEIFDAEGRFTTKVSYSSMPTTYTYEYDKAKKIITVSQKIGNLPPLKNLYQYNQNQEVEFTLYKENDPLRKYDYKGTLLVKDSGANKFSTQKVYYSYYEYNSKGQLAKLKAFNGDGKPSREEVYTYEKNTVTIKGKAYWTIGKVDEYEKKKCYDAKGSLIKSTHTQNDKTEITEYKLDTQGNWIWKTDGVTRKITYYDIATNAATKTVITSNATLAAVEKKVEVKVISPEPYETTYKNELVAANDYKARGLAFAKYVDGLMTTSLTESEKETLLIEKTKQMIEIDFMGYQHMVMKVKNQNVSFVYKKTSLALTADQTAAFKAANQYAIDEFTSMQNNTTKPVWPAIVPKPGYGWGKAVSSDKYNPLICMQSNLSYEERFNLIRKNLKEGKTVASQDISWAIVYEDANKKNVATTNSYSSQYSNSSYAQNDNNLLKMLIGKMYKYENAQPLSKTACQVTGYKDKNEIYITCQNGEKRTVTYDELVNNKGLFGYKFTNTAYTCKVCKGTGVSKKTFSHTNDYQYTLGQKHTYTTTTTSTCGACGGGGYTY
ncbi:MAG: hypothetical protein KA319_09215 [Ferruginibacter sp.]|nr:hypothetical protein [Ferruginibacter sp.]